MTKQNIRLKRGTALVFGVCVSMLIAAVVTDRFPPLMFWFLAGWTIGIVVHELGHAACAAVASIPVHRIVIGGGPLLWRSRSRHATIDVRAFPVHGHVQCYPSVTNRGCRAALLVIGGTMGNLAVIGLLGAPQLLGVPQPVADVLDVMTKAQVVVIVFSLWPTPASLGGSDGLLLLQLLWRPARNHPAALRAALDAWGLPMTPASLRLLCHLDKLSGDERTEARDELVHELEGCDLSRAERATILDILVTDSLVTGDPVLRPRLDAWSLQLVELEPDRPTRWGSRGSVLVELGRYQEGKALLAALAAPDQPPFDAFMSRVFIAFAENGLGNTAAARQSADAARATTGVTPAIAAAVLARLDRELPPATAAPATD